MSRRPESRPPSITSEGRGRPPSFEREEALDAAMRVFWEQGYEGTSILDLKKAMGLSASSIYSAFQDKAHLYARAVDRYSATAGAYGRRILKAADEARTGFEQLLLTAAWELTRPDQPKGCLIAIALLHGGAEVQPVRTAMAKQRAGQLRMFRELIEKDIAHGRLPSGVKAAELASFFLAVLQGMSARARDGASRETLEGIARIAMKAWPADARAGTRRR